MILKLIGNGMSYFSINTYPAISTVFCSASTHLPHTPSPHTPSTYTPHTLHPHTPSPHTLHLHTTHSLTTHHTLLHPYTPSTYTPHTPSPHTPSTHTPHTTHSLTAHIHPDVKDRAYIAEKAASVTVESFVPKNIKIHTTDAEARADEQITTSKRMAVDYNKNNSNCH